MKQRNFLEMICYFVLTWAISSCDNRKSIYSGTNERVKSQLLTLFDNETFFIKLKSGEAQGSYQLNHDTVRLIYIDNYSAQWPATVLLRKGHFVALDN